MQPRSAWLDLSRWDRLAGKLSPRLLAGVAFDCTWNGDTLPMRMPQRAWPAGPLRHHRCQMEIGSIRASVCRSKSVDWCSLAAENLTASRNF